MLSICQASIVFIGNAVLRAPQVQRDCRWFILECINCFLCMWTEDTADSRGILTGRSVSTRSIPVVFSAMCYHFLQC